MKTKLYIIVIALTTSICIYAQSNFFYSSTGNEIYFNVREDKVILKTRSAITDELNDQPAFKSIERISYNLAIVTVNKIDNQISELKKNPDIVDATYLLEYIDGTLQIPTNTLFIKSKKGKDIYSGIEEAKLLTNIVSVKLTNTIDSIYSVTLNISVNDILEICQLLYLTGSFEFVEPDFIRLNCFQSDPLLSDQWGLKNTGQHNGFLDIDIKAQSAWTITKGNSRIKVGIIDSGIEITHPDLAGNVLSHYNALDSATIINDNQGGLHDGAPHGTACAGIVGAIENDIGIIGVVPESKLVSVRIGWSWYGVVTYIRDSWAAEGIRYAWQEAKVDVLSNSWGGGSPSDNLIAQIQDAATYGRDGKGCVIIFAAGNSNTTVSRHASLVNVLSVGAISPCGERKRSSSNPDEVNNGVTPDPNGVSCDGQLTWGSCYGENLDIMAPGAFISTTDLLGNAGYNKNNTANDYEDKDYTGTFGGTSSACPHVAGVAALVLSVNPNLTGQQVRDIIESTAQKIRPDLYTYSTEANRPNGTWHEEMGYGLVDAYEAVRAAQETVPPYDLIVRDDTLDTGFEPNPATLTWDSPDIWFEYPLGNRIPNVGNYASCYVNVRIHNKGNEASSGNERLYLYWTKKGLGSVWPQSWDGKNYFRCGLNGNYSYPPKGGFISSEDGFQIPSIPPGGSIVLPFDWNTPNNEDYWSCLLTVPFLERPNWDFGILARIDDGNPTPGINQTSYPTGTFVLGANNVAVSTGGIIYRDWFREIINIEAAWREPVRMEIAQLKKTEQYILSDFAELYISLSPELIEFWKGFGAKGEGFELVDENKLRITSEKAVLLFPDALPETEQPHFMETEVHFISDEIPEVNDFGIDISILSAENGELRDRIRFTAVRDLERYFKAIAESEKEKIVKNETVTLSAQSIGESASYIWYNAAGDTIGTGTQLSVTPVATQSYKLEVQATADGYKSYDSVRVAVTEGVITAIAPNPANTQATISYALSEGTTNAALQVISATGITLATYPIATDTNSQQLSLGNFAQGHYTVKLLSGGKLMDSKALVVQ